MTFQVKENFKRGRGQQNFEITKFLVKQAKTFFKNAIISS
jgi:hypothetical protein